MAFKHAYLSSCSCNPEADGAVIGAGGEQATIRRPRHAIDRTGMPLKSVQEFETGWRRLLLSFSLFPFSLFPSFPSSPYSLFPFAQLYKFIRLIRVSPIECYKDENDQYNK